MLMAELLESTTTELAMNQEVHQDAMAVLRYVHEGNDPYTNVHINGHDYYVYRSGDIGLNKSFLLLIGLLEQSAEGMSGAVATLNQPLFDHTTAIVIYCLQEFTIPNLRRTVNSVGFMRKFEHETLHLLDTERTNDRILATGDSADMNSPDYYNHPAEFNAYYHDIAKGMMAAIQNPQAANTFTGNWQTDISRILNQSRHAQEFVANLRPERRKALLRRLYRLYQQMLQTMRSPGAAAAA